MVPISLVVCSVLLVLSVSSVSPAKYQPKWKKQACEIPSSQNEYSHYICTDDGEVKCLPGWTGDLCDVPRCRSGCDPLQGYCNRPGECLCKLGYYGERCNKCIPLPGCQRGYCNTSFECICHEGWDSIFCSEPICRSDCHSTRGYCEAPGECLCRLGWSGRSCKECQVLPGCIHGYCEKPLECKCHPGYTGILCQTPICSSTCHKERGYCRKPGECRCKIGWWGENCEKCFPYPGCVHGSCRRPWECNCRKGWGGMLCDEELQHCEKNPGICQNGSKCISVTKDDGSYKCLCREGTSGRNCEHSEYHTVKPITVKPIPITSSAEVEEVTANTTTNIIDDKEMGITFLYNSSTTTTTTSASTSPTTITKADAVLSENET